MDVYKYGAFFPPKKDAVHQFLALSFTIEYHSSPGSTQRSKSVFRNSQLLIARKCVNKRALHHRSLFDFLFLEYGRQHVSPLCIHPFPSSRCHLHHPLRAVDNPPYLPAYQDPRLVSDTHRHRRSLYADFATCPEMPLSLIRSSQLNGSATLGVRSPVSRAVIGQSDPILCKAFCS